MTVYFEPSQWAQLRERSRRTKVPACEYVRQAVDEWLERNEPPAESSAAAAPVGLSEGLST